MSRNRCVNPIPHPKIIGMDMPCRKCSPCVKMTRVEWMNRMKLESLGKKFHPLFVTWTFKPEVYDNSEKTCKAEITKNWKRLRKAGHDIRYFTVIERGEHNNRLHGHSIIWSESLRNYLNPTAVLEKVWGNGIVDAQIIQGAKGFSYVTKYMVKDLNHEKSRNYSWSMSLGKPGLEYWRNAIYSAYEDGRQWSIDDLPPNKITVPILGKIDTCYIPRANYVDFCKLIGINFMPNDPLLYDKYHDPLIDYGTSKSKIYSQEQLYRASKAR